MFVEDDHGLLRPSTMALASKTLIEFFDLGEGAVSKGDVVEEEETRGRHVSPLQRNVEVKTSPWLPRRLKFLTQKCGECADACRYLSLRAI